MSYDLAVIGGGNMGTALLGGLLQGEVVSVEHVVIVELHAERSEQLTAMFPGVTITDSVPSCRSAVLSVKPPDIVAVAAEAAAAGARRVLSIAAGVTIGAIEWAVGDGVAVLRAMPNTPAAIGQGVSVLVANRHVGAAQKELCTALMAAVGTVHWIDDEELMHAITAMSGGGPAYLFLLIETLARAGVASGLPAELAWPLARGTIAGSGALAAQSDQPAEVLRQNVTSPGGTTQAALAVLMAEDGIQALFDRAIAAGARRSRELA